MTMAGLFVGMEWFPDCRDGGLDRYFFELIGALAGVGMAGTALVSAAARSAIGEIQVKGMAGKDASV